MGEGEPLMVPDERAPRLWLVAGTTTGTRWCVRVARRARDRWRARVQCVGRTRIGIRSAQVEAYIINRGELEVEDVLCDATVNHFNESSGNTGSNPSHSTRRRPSLNTDWVNYAR